MNFINRTNELEVRYTEQINLKDDNSVYSESSETLSLVKEIIDLLRFLQVNSAPAEHFHEKAEELIAFVEAKQEQGSLSNVDDKIFFLIAKEKIESLRNSFRRYH